MICANPLVSLLEGDVTAPPGLDVELSLLPDIDDEGARKGPGEADAPDEAPNAAKGETPGFERAAKPEAAKADVDV